MRPLASHIRRAPSAGLSKAGGPFEESQELLGQKIAISARTLRHVGAKRREPSPVRIHNKSLCNAIGRVCAEPGAKMSLLSWVLEPLGSLWGQFSAVQLFRGLLKAKRASSHALLKEFGFFLGPVLSTFALRTHMLDHLVIMPHIFGVVLGSCSALGQCCYICLKYVWSHFGFFMCLESFGNICLSHFGVILGLMHGFGISLGSFC